MAKKKTTTTEAANTTVAVLPDLSEVLPPPAAILGTTIDADPSTDHEIPDGPYAVIVRYDTFSPPELIGSRGVTVIEFDTEDFNPWFLDTVEDVDAAERKMEHAIALLEAAEWSQEAEDAMRDLDMTLGTLDDVRVDLVREEVDELD